MTRIALVNPDAPGRSADLLAAVRSKLGLVPNMTRAMANAPAVLEGYLGLSGALGGGALDARLRQRIALLVAQENECTYCLSAHTAIGKRLGMSEVDLADARRGRSDAKSTAALRFGARLLAERGGVSDDDLRAVRDAGFSDGEIAEIVAHVALNVLTNLFNRAFAVDVDFPVVAARAA
ncbi:MAG TPA: carboxymuconolactone decarboxylase family protein [Planctomycetota bacterium]|nr:carboxymuconolactone decarboxylase family protein [Planctomycetota bacterium]